MMRARQRVFAAVAAAATAMIAGCTSGNVVSRDDTAVPQADEPRIDDADTDPQSRTIETMLARARTDRLAGRLASAEATIEAALRIAPSDARLWLELAQTRFAAGEFANAATLAERAMSLAGDDAGIIETGQRIRAQAAQ